MLLFISPCFAFCFCFSTCLLTSVLIQDLFSHVQAETLSHYVRVVEKVYMCTGKLHVWQNG